MTSKNNWLSNNLDEIQYYLTSQDNILIERKRCINILLRLFYYQFNNQQNLEILDIGCGDGVLTHIINDNFSGNNFTLIDGSQLMLQKAKERLAKLNVNYLEITFEQFINEPIADNKYDFAFSSMAIHHLPFSKKEMLFEKIYHELRSNGLFINIDVVLPESLQSEEWQFNLWRDWISENALEDVDGTVRERTFNTPSIYKNKSENKPSGLIEQMLSLKKIGFRNVDCFFKYGIFTLYGGSKK